MKNYEKIMEALTHCGHNNPCENCPYKTVSDCSRQLNDDAVRLIEELVDRLEQPKITETDISIPNYEAIAQSHSEEICKLHDQLCCVTMERDRAYANNAEVQKELAYLRAIKATAEAFLGVKIDGQM